MKIGVAAACLSLGLIAGVAHCAEDTHADLLIKNVSIVSAERDGPSNPTDVLIRGDRIASIGTTDLPLEAVGEVIDGEGRFLTPGYIDGHVHLWDIPGMRHDQERENPKISAAARAQFPRSYLYHGFTTLIDLFANAALKERWSSFEAGPDVHYCGALIIQDGYPSAHIPIPQRYEFMPNFIYDPARSEVFPEGFNRADHSPEKLVQKISEDGAICVKSFYEPGFGGQMLWPTPSEDILRRIKAEAAKHGLPFLLHAHSEEAQRVGVRIGANALAHGMWSWSSFRGTDITDSVRTILDDIIDQRIGWQPTFQVLFGERDLHDPDYLSGSDLKHVLPRNLINWYASEDGQWYRDIMADKPYFKRYLEAGRWQDIDGIGIKRLNAAFRYLDTHDGHILFGSDTISDMTYANPPGLNGWQEMERWLANGASPAKLFKAATLDNALFFGLEDEIGTVEVGKRANLLILRENPMKLGYALNEIDVVIVKGRAIERPALSASIH